MTGTNLIPNLSDKFQSGGKHGILMYSINMEDYPKLVQWDAGSCQLCPLQDIPVSRTVAVAARDLPSGDD